MDFKRAKHEFDLQADIREEKVGIQGVTGEKLDDLLQYGLEQLEAMRPSKEGLQNESAILNMAENLGIEKKDLEEKFLDGLRYNIKAGYRSNIINEHSPKEDIRVIVGAYVLSFRSALNRFNKEKLHGHKETSTNILDIAKKMYLLSPKIVDDLRKKYQDNPEINDSMIKYFVIHNSKDPEKAIETALQKIIELKQKYPEINDSMIKYFVIHNLKDPEKAIETALQKIIELKQKYPEINDSMIKYFVINNPKDPDGALERELRK